VLFIAIYNQLWQSSRTYTWYDVR